MQEDRIKRINELYHLSKQRQLTEEELKEQGILRAEYLSAIRSSVKGQLGQVRIVEKDGSVNPLLSIREKKENYRKTCLSIRSGIGEDRKKDAGSFLKGEVLKIVKILKVNKVLLYASKADEVPTDEIFETLNRSGIEIYYPVTKEDELIFYKTDSLSELIPGTFGVREPNNREESRIFRYHPKDDSVLIIVPGLSFDDAGNRIGYGKGYYDRFLSEYVSDSTVKTAGICYVECKSRNVSGKAGFEIPYEKNDVRMDFVIYV